MVTNRGSYWDHYHFLSLSGTGDSAIECPLSKTGNDIRVSSVVDCLEGRNGIQRFLDKLGIWGGMVVMKVNRTKCKILNLKWSNLSNGYWMGNESIKSIPKEKDVG